MRVWPPRAMACVTSIHLSGRLALLDDGTTVPITVLVDACGDETTDEDDAVAFVCGSDERGWFSDLIKAYGRVAVQ